MDNIRKTHTHKTYLNSHDYYTNVMKTPHVISFAKSTDVVNT